MQRKTQLLEKSRYFHGLPQEILDKIGAVATLQEVPGGKMIIQEGSKADAMYILEKGVVDVYTEDRTTGSERLLRRLASGDCFGELAFLVGRRRTANVRARGDSHLLEIRTEDLDILMRKLSPVAIAICKSLAEWLHTTNGQLGYRFVKLATFPLQTELVASFSKKKMEYFRAVPLHKDSSRVVVGMVDPTDLPAVDALRREFEGLAVETVAVMESELDQFIKVTIPKILSSTDGWGRR